MVQSPELTGGAGFTFEDKAIAIYLVALIGEANAPGLPGRTVSRVALQQAAFGEPLDDLIVDGRAVDGTTARLSLQVKRELTISAAVSNTDFREIVLRSWATLAKAGFRQGIDRVGAVTGTVAESARRALIEVYEWARESASVETFFARFDSPDFSGERRKETVEVFRTILTASSSGPVDDTAIYDLFRHFVLITIDVMHEGATDEADAIARLRPVLPPEDVGRVDDLWHRLGTIARQSAGRAGELTRPLLIEKLHGAFRLVTAPSLTVAINSINTESNLAIASIPFEICGVKIPRPLLEAKCEAAMAKHRFVQIAGLPGAGKSAILRALAASKQATGTILVLKADRLSGISWPAYAQSIGIPGSDLQILLLEVGVTGTPILFIDGIDRIEVVNRGVLLDVLNAILKSPALENWKIIATCRDNGMEPLRTWLPSELLNDGGIGTVEIAPFDDTESAVLAKEKPVLGPLLFGEDRVREIARRPFFAAILADATTDSGSPAPRSEIELLQRWWARGGYNSTSDRHMHRQRMLVQLAKAGAATLGRRIRLPNTGLDALIELKTDGIIKDVQPGHTVQFTHDIFFEWAFVHVLIDQEEAWPDEIRGIGEPPVLGRTVELLSQAEFSGGDKWQSSLEKLESLNLRPQWVRAWMLGPFGLPTFADRSQKFTEMVLSDAQRLAKLVVWFQAEKTQANPKVLAGETTTQLSRDDLVRLAEALAWPSDPATWSRFCIWILTIIDNVPVSVFPDVVVVFEVWQNMFGGYRNTVSARIITVVSEWLQDIEDRCHAEEFNYAYGQWELLTRGELSELETSLRRMLLRSAPLEAKRIESYLTRISGRRRLRGESFKEIILFSATLTKTHPNELMALAIAELKGDLPLDIAKRPDEGRRLYRTFGHHDWQSLSIRDSNSRFFPASPTREPFSSLFLNAPSQAQELVRELANHAISAWRQLFTLDPQRRGTPLPIILEFPWGKQEFWGDNQVYVWSRGHWAPHPIEAGLMALESWGFAKLERGDDADDVIRELVTAHQSCAVLCIAVAIALTSQRVSPTTLPLITAQQIWHFDVQRLVLERSIPANLMGFGGVPDEGHSQAVKAGNERPCRRMDVRNLAMLAVLNSNETLRSAAKAAITAFPENIPFGFEEEKGIDEIISERRRTAQIWAEIGKAENYFLEPSPDRTHGYIRMENPTANDPDVQAVVKRSARMNDQWTVLNWVTDSFERQAISPRMSTADALQQARDMDKKELFAEPHHTAFEEDLDRGAVSGVAAAALVFEKDLKEEAITWATSVIFRACQTPDDKRRFPLTKSLPVHHPCSYAVHGLSGLIRRNIENQNARHAMLRLAGHSLEEISATAISSAISLWDVDPKLAWCAFNLGIHLSIGEATEDISSVETAVSARIAEMINGAIAEIDSPDQNFSLENLPPAWVYASYPSALKDETEASAEPTWRDPDSFLRWDFLPKFLKAIPIGALLRDKQRRPAFLGFCGQLVAWSTERIAPSWASDKTEFRANELHEWNFSVFHFLGHVAVELDVIEAETLILAPVLKLGDEPAMSLLSSFINSVICIGILDAPEISPHASTLLQLCIHRILQHHDWRYARTSEGDIGAFHLPDIIRALLMVKIERADLAARFVNGDWREIGKVIPIFDGFVRTLGDIPGVAGPFLTLCERAAADYPGKIFVEQISAILATQAGTPVGWRNGRIPSRIAALIQTFAEKLQPLPQPIAQSMLRILDRLVDMGDRRSAGLQTSEIFKTIRL